MKLYKYITEAKAEEIEYDDPRVESNNIKKQSKRYFNILGNNKPLYRSVRQKILASDVYLKKQTRTDRESLVLTPISQNIVNNELQKLGHNRRDQSVSVSSNYNHVKRFVYNENKGSVYYFIPIGNFSYSWCPSRDFNFPTDKWDVSHLLDDKEYEYYIQKLRDSFEKVKTDKGFISAYKNGFEIWFRCKEYYLIEPKSDLGRYF